MKCGGSQQGSPLSTKHQEVATAQAISGPFPALDKDLPHSALTNLLHWKVFSTAASESQWGRTDRSRGLSYGAMHTCAQHPGQCWGPGASEATATASAATSSSPPGFQARIFTHAQAAPEAPHVLGEVLEWGQMSGELHACPSQNALCTILMCSFFIST